MELQIKLPVIFHHCHNGAAGSIHSTTFRDDHRMGTKTSRWSSKPCDQNPFLPFFKKKKMYEKKVGALIAWLRLPFWLYLTASLQTPLKTFQEPQVPFLWFTTFWEMFLKRDTNSGSNPSVVQCIPYLPMGFVWFVDVPQLPFVIQSLFCQEGV